jgi:hypothetical protein
MSIIKHPCPKFPFSAKAEQIDMDEQIDHASRPLTIKQLTQVIMINKKIKKEKCGL